MFLSGGKNEDSMCRWLLKSLEECIEGCLREHVDLIDDIDTIPSYLRRDSNLLHKGLDVFNTIV